MNAYDECIKVFNKDANINTVIFGVYNEQANTNYIPLSEYKQISLENDGLQGYVWEHIFKTSDLKEKEIYFPENVYYEDGVFLIKYYINIIPLYYGIGKTFYFYRKRHGQITQNYKAIKDAIEGHNWFIDYIEKNNLKNKAHYLLIKQLYSLKNYMYYLDKIEDNEKWKVEYKKYISLIERMDLNIVELNNLKDFDLYRSFVPHKEIGLMFSYCIRCIENLYEINDDEYIVNEKELNKFKKYINKYYNKNIKYRNIKENIIIYKLKREIKRIIKQIKGIFIKDK